LARFNVNGSLDDGSPWDTNPSDRFGSNGRVITEFAPGNEDLAYAVVIQRDYYGEKIVVAGGTGPSHAAKDFALARYSLNGQLDTTFDWDGLVTTDFGNGDDVAKDVVIHQGKLLAGGSAWISSDQDFALARYTNAITVTIDWPSSPTWPWSLWVI
jgi:hypothetical protein